MRGCCGTISIGVVDALVALLLVISMELRGDK